MSQNTAIEAIYQRRGEKTQTGPGWTNNKKMSTFHSACVCVCVCACVWGVPVRPDLYLFKQGRERKKKNTHTQYIYIYIYIKFTEQLLRFGARLYTYKMRVDLCQLPGNRKDRRANKVRTLPLPASLG